MTVRESLLTISNYPIPDAFLESIGEEVGIDMDGELTEVDDPVPLNRARARAYIFLATAPNVSEGGVSISFTATEKAYFLSLAKRYAALAGETGLFPGPAYGYKGQNI